MPSRPRRATWLLWLLPRVPGLQLGTACCQPAWGTAELCSSFGANQGSLLLLERSQIRAVSSEDDRHVAGKCLKMSEVLVCDLCCFRGIGDLTLSRLSSGPLGQHFPCYR